MTRAHWMAIVAFCMPACARAQTGDISGHVINALTGAPLPKAAVSLFGLLGKEERRLSSSATTDAAGAFLFSGLEPGVYHLRASRNAFADFAYGWKRSRGDKPIPLAGGQHVDLSLPLMPATAISGTVLDEDGDPVVSAQVKVWHEQFDEGRRILNPAQNASTDDRGRYRVFGLDPGVFYLSVSTPPYTSLKGASSGYITTFYSATVDPAAATPLRAAGQEIESINFRLRKSPLYRIRGKVADLGPKESRPPSIMLAYTNLLSQATQALSGSVSSEGDFEISGVPPGTYDLIADTVHGEQPWWIRRPIDISSDLDGLAVTIPPPGAVVGRIDAGETGGVDLSSLHVRLQPAWPNTVMFSKLEAQVEKDGAFRVTGVPQDRFRLTVYPLPEKFYLKSLRSQQGELEDHVVESGAGGLEIVLGDKDGSVSGTVLTADDRPAAAAVVVLIAKAARRRSGGWDTGYLEAVSDEAGRVNFPHVVPGEYLALAWDDLEPGRFMDPEFIRPFESQAVAVKVEENGHAALRIVALPAN